MSDAQITLVIIAAVSASMIVGLGLLWPRIKAHKQSWQIMSFFLAAMLGTLTIATSVQAFRLQQPGPTASPSPGPDGSPAGPGPQVTEAAPTNLAELEFTAPKTGDVVGQNPPVSLKGDLRQGERLWIFVRSEQKLYVQGPAEEAPNGWSFTDLTLGGDDPDDARSPYTIVAVLANSQANTKIEELESKTHGDEPVDLPAGTRPGPEVKVVRSK